MAESIKVLIDTNVIIDYIAEREPYVHQAVELIKLCTSDKIIGCIAAHTVTNIFYILRKEFSAERRKEFLLDLCSEFTVIGLNSNKIIAALKNDNFDDLEDCLQDECAADFEAEYIIIYNNKKYKRFYRQ